MVEESEEEPPGQRLLLLTLILLCGLQGVTAEEDGISGKEIAEVSAGTNRGIQETRVRVLLLNETTNSNTYMASGGITVYSESHFNLILSGDGIEEIKAVQFTTSNSSYGESCYGTDAGYHISDIFETIERDSEAGLAVVSIDGRGLTHYDGQRTYYLCIKTFEGGNFVHQGSRRELAIYVDSPFMPAWLMGILIAILLCMSGLFSGLNLGLMSLDQTELKIVQNTGTDREKGYATAIMPIRAMGNFLLCSILLGNVLVNNTMTILLDVLTGGGGTIAVICSTLGIVVFGEIIPQAICSRHGLAVGAKTILLTKFFMLITAPLSFPISKILDCILGTEIGTVYNKQRLMELLKVTEQYNGLEKDEINIVTGALVLKQKYVKDVMTNIEDCYMLPIESILDFETISEIKEQGYSRIPVYQGGDRKNVVYLLFAKDLLFVDPDDEKPIEEICKFYQNDVNFVYSDTILTDMFDEFKSGEKGHLALVQEVNTEGDSDPFYETVGLVTLEDIIEEIIQQEIIDETDTVIDNKTKKKRKRERFKKDAEVKMFQGAKHAVAITPHENMAVLQFLTTSVRAFAPENIRQSILKKLLTMDVFREVKVNKEGKENEEPPVIMAKGKPCDYFLMVIEGKVEVTIGKEERRFQDGPFSCYGEPMLAQALVNLNPASPMVNGTSSRGASGSQSAHLRKTNTQQQLNVWIPDYSVRALTDLVYLKVRRNTYLVAIKASRMAQSSNPISEHDLSNAFANVMANDRLEDQARTPMASPEKGSNSDTSDLRRRESLRSSLNAMKKKILGGTSGERKEDFWDPAAPATSDIENLSSSDAASSLNSGGKKENGEHLVENGHELGPKSLPSLAPLRENGTLPPVRRTQAANVVRRNSIAKMGNGNKEKEGEGEDEERTTNGNTTVILVRGNTEEEEEKDS